MMPDKSLAGYRYLFGLIGYPLGHSFSKKYFNEKFAREGLSDHYYEAFPLENVDQLPGLIKSCPNLRGLNVTIPYKEQVLPYLQRIDKEAGQVGAVNVIRVEEGILTGYNSDIHGFEKDLEDFLGSHRRDKLPALVFGNGGAARAVVHVLKKWGYPFLTVSRSEGKSDIVYSAISKELIQSHPLLINTTPLGMAPNTATSPEIPYHALSPGHFLYDLVYNPAETTFLKKGMQMGAKTRNGLGMLYGQAEKAWEYWNPTSS